MKEIKYKKYSKKQMLKIIQKYGFLFVETNLGDDYIISKNDIADFIMLESQRTCYTADMEFYIPSIYEPVLTTLGCFLDKINTILREEIIDRLVLLQTTNIKPKNIKIFDNEMFIKLSPKEKGIIDGKVNNFAKLYEKYIVTQ